MLDSEILLTIKLQQALFVDPKRIRLLREIDQCGSINQAAKNAEVSYKSAWDHLEAMNHISPKPLLERNIGGKNGGGTCLTNYAKRLIKLYDLLEQTQKKAFEILQDEEIPLDNFLSATARFSPQSSARNQFFGTVKHLTIEGNRCDVAINVEHLTPPMVASITTQSAERLQFCSGKEVMLMIKAPWVKVFTKKPIYKTNVFPSQLGEVKQNHESYEAILILNNQLPCNTSLSKPLPLRTNDNLFCYINPKQIVLLTLF